MDKFKILEKFSSNELDNLVKVIRQEIHNRKNITTAHKILFKIRAIQLKREKY